MNFPNYRQTDGVQMLKKLVFLSVLFCLPCFFITSYAAKKVKCPPLGPKMTVQEYCDKYGEEARKQMKKYGIPASITLAQGILESGYGSSYLAIEARNHFGIKAYSRGWTGPVVKCDDDAKDEPFCKFKTVEEGYEYHSTFLRNNTRYNPLFTLDIRDYESWANGLKKCGYATNPKYAQLLIDLIEKNHLDAYDVKKAETLYAEIDRNPLFVGTAAKEDRSIMNVCFVMAPGHEDLQDEFLAFAKANGMVGVKGHRSVGGFRASIYNACPKESVQALIDCMQEFEKLHK